MWAKAEAAVGVGGGSVVLKEFVPLLLDRRAAHPGGLIVNRVETRVRRVPTTTVATTVATSATGLLSSPVAPPTATLCGEREWFDAEKGAARHVQLAGVGHHDDAV